MATRLRPWKAGDGTGWQTPDGRFLLAPRVSARRADLRHRGGYDVIDTETGDQMKQCRLVDACKWISARTRALPPGVDD
jgi:hypothetical protein